MKFERVKTAVVNAAVVKPAIGHSLYVLMKGRFSEVKKGKKTIVYQAPAIDLVADAPITLQVSKAVVAKIEQAMDAIPDAAHHQFELDCHKGADDHFSSVDVYQIETKATVIDTKPGK